VNWVLYVKQNFDGDNGKQELSVYSLSGSAKNN